MIIRLSAKIICILVISIYASLYTEFSTITDRIDLYPYHFKAIPVCLNVLQKDFSVFQEFFSTLSERISIHHEYINNGIVDAQ